MARMSRDTVEPVAAGSEPFDLGWLPRLALVSSFGLLLMSFGYTGARAGDAWAEPLVWTGLLLMYVPITARLGMQSASRVERISQVCLLGVVLYIAKVLQSPIAFTF